MQNAEKILQQASACCSLLCRRACSVLATQLQCMTMAIVHVAVSGLNACSSAPQLQPLEAGMLLQTAAGLHLPENARLWLQKHLLLIYRDLHNTSISEHAATSTYIHHHPAERDNANSPWSGHHLRMGLLHWQALHRSRVCCAKVRRHRGTPNEPMQ